MSGLSNYACNNYSGIGTGFGNIINVSNGAYEFIGAGYGNTISSGYEGFIGSGSSNTIGSPGGNAFIGDGVSNTASGEDAVIGGGSHNIANGSESTVPGGGDNSAQGYASLAAGYHADANQAGTFVWSDSSSSSATKATAAYQFVARASGGVTFFSNAAMTTGVELAAGGGSWASVSDRAVKDDVQSIDDAGILDKVAGLPITEWSYVSERGVRHIGPMAQDFRAAFDIGEDNKHITSIDEDGVALAAIKALNRKLEARDAALQREIVALSAKVNATHPRQ